MMNKKTHTPIGISPEEEAAFLQALQDPDTRQEIIRILEEAELRRE